MNGTPHRVYLCFILLISSAICLWVCQAPAAQPQMPLATGELPPTGRGLYETACMACHGNNGTGEKPSRVGFETPFPNFSDCSFASREGNQDWLSVVAEGGPARAFSKTTACCHRDLTGKPPTAILPFAAGPQQT